MFIQLQEVMGDHKDINLPKIQKENQRIVTRIEDFDIDCVLDEETHVNIMPESAWEILGNPVMIPSLGRIGLFKGNMITLCGRITNIHMIAHEISIEEEFEVIKFVENNVPFPLLLGKTWIEKDHIRRKEEEEATEKKKKELRDLIARRIDRLLEEREVESKQQNEIEVVVKVERAQEGLEDLSMQEKSISTQDLVSKEVLPLNPGSAPVPTNGSVVGKSAARSHYGKRR
jgi:hypothetical protein